MTSTKLLGYSTYMYVTCIDVYELIESLSLCSKNQTKTFVVNILRLQNLQNPLDRDDFYLVVAVYHVTNVANGHGQFKRFQPMAVSCVLRTAGSSIVFEQKYEVIPELSISCSISKAFSCSNNCKSKLNIFDNTNNNNNKTKNIC